LKIQPQPHFSSKVAVVTDAASGIGAAVCLRLALDGANVAAWDRDLDGAQATVLNLRERGGVGRAFLVDVSDYSAVCTTASATAQVFGDPTLLVNCAGTLDIRRFLDQTPETWRSAMAVNLDSLFYCTLEIARAMKRAGGGAIVNLASVAGTVAYPNRASYVTAKAGVIGLTRAAALDLSEYNIRVNAVAPSHVATPPSRAGDR
jgi:NAD(P)-dependent dehydrogenase (short-subunit alcohol dehydrogenase family)